jgi:hypothetical protein
LYTAITGAVNKSSPVRERELGNDIVYSRETVLSKKDQIRTKTYYTLLYSPQKISDLLASVGLSSINCITDFMNRGAE